ncbi:hypothetical protein sos41_36770 [Alphaproteobacteria bacterium SO-S41]|nr:hypothetical protein sos41_36770 [Alphaproteobacteria bacterium SO-S41]
MRNALLAASLLCALSAAPAFAVEPSTDPAGLAGEWKLEGTRCRVVLSGEAADDITATTVSFVAGPRSCGRNIAKVRYWHREGDDRIVMKDAKQRAVMALVRAAPVRHAADY